MSYSEVSLAVIEFEINDCNSKKEYYTKRLTELIEIREKIRREVIREYEDNIPIGESETFKELLEGEDIW